MLEVITHKLGELDNFVYVLEHNGQAVFVDPAWDSEILLASVQSRGLLPCGVILTHSHFDHINALSGILDVYPDLPIYIHEIEAHLERFDIESLNIHFVDDGDVVSLAGIDFSVIATPGHTLGSVCYATETCLFSGDTLFINGIGRCDFQDSDVRAMYASLQKLRMLSDSLVVYPGHDYGDKATDTLGNQFMANPYFIIQGDIQDPDFFADVRLRTQSKFHRIPFPAQSKTNIMRIYEEQAL